jgi:chaperone modulatory protein CbpM
MMHLTAAVALFTDLGLTNVGEPELIAWIERGWVRPERTGAEPVFHDIDIARIRLIHDMRILMRIDDETIPLVLSLLDQVYDLRTGLRAVLRAVEAQPEPVREAILAAID